MTDIDSDSEEAPKLFDAKLTRRLMHYVRTYKRFVVFSVFVLLAMALAITFLPVLIKTAIDSFLAVGSDVLSADERFAGLVKIGIVYLAVSAFGFSLRYGESYLMAWVGQNVVRDLRSDIFAKILRMPFRFFNRTPVGTLLTRVTSDVEAMQKFVTEGLVGLIADLFMILGVTGFMIYLSPRLVLTLFLVLPVLVAVLTYVNYRLRKAHRDVRLRQSLLNAYLQETITGMTTIQLFNREGYALDRFDELSSRFRRGGLEAVRWFSYYFPTLEVLGAFSIALVLIVGGHSILNNTGVTIGTLVAFLAYTRDFFRPFEDLSEKSSVLQQAMASSERIFSLLDLPETITDPETPANITSFKGDVQFDGVWFAYNKKEWVLRDVSLNISRGQSVALVGATGAGKTSIISLISRFYDVQQGAVRVDGHDVRDLKKADLRRRIGVVLQDPFIFSGSIASNIDLHNPDLSREEVIQAARYVNAHNFIERLPDGYDTILSERGSTLSTGQKQLLALARALVQNPDILLILDEATANVDTETEMLIQDAMGKLMHGRTSIVIAHRLSTIRHVDRIYVMRHGEVVESGSHTELVREGGYYKRLYDLLSHSTHQ